MNQIKFCLQCNKHMDKRGRYCSTCIKSNRKASSYKYLNKFLDANVCFKCSKPLDRIGRRCVECNQKYLKIQRDINKFRLVNNLCKKCHKPVSDNNTYCLTCRIQINKYAKELRKRKAVLFYKEFNQQKEEINETN